MAAASVAERQKASQELQDAAAESDPTRAAALRAAAAQDAAKASADRAAAARELRRARAEQTRATREARVADGDRAKAGRDAARARGEQQRAQRQAAVARKILICHATASARNPYVEIEVDRNGLNGHGDHLADLIPAPAGGCPQMVSPVKLEQAKGAGPLDESRDAANEAAKAHELESRAAADAAQARKEEGLAKSEQASSRTEASSAAAAEKKASQEHRAAATESDPAKAAQLEAAARGDGRLADSEQLLSDIDKSLSGLERTEADQDAALARKERSEADEETARAEDEQELAQEQAAAGKVMICHATGSAGNPYVEIEVAAAGLNGHGGHTGDIVPAPVDGCPTAAGAGALADAEAHDARTRVPLPGGPLDADLSANESSAQVGETVRLELSAANLGSKPARDIELCGAVPAGFSLVSAPGARLVDGAPCRTIGRLDAASVSTFAVHLRLNSRVRRVTHVRLALVLKVEARRASRARLDLRVSGGGAIGAPPTSPHFTG